MPRPTLLAALALATAIASCTTLSEEECRAGDWSRIGVADGAEGRGPERLEAHRRACAGVGIVPDAEAWLAGRERGLRLYCTPEKAYEVGREGRPIAAGCTVAERARMEPAFDWGRRWWRLELEIEDIRSDMRGIDHDIAASPPDAPGRGGLFAERMQLLSRLSLLRLRQRQYDSWPP